MDKIIQKLEGVVKDRTPQYISLSNPQHDEKLMKAHYLLAKLYGRKRDTSQAHDHFRQAEYEFLNLCLAKTQEQKYVVGGLEGFRKFRAQEKKTEKRLENYKGKLFSIADEIGYDATSLLLFPTSSNPRKDNLVEKINEDDIKIDYGRILYPDKHPDFIKPLKRDYIE